MKWLKSNWYFILGILIPCLLVFRAFLDLSNPLAWGDAPHFYASELEGLTGKTIFEPLAWTNRGTVFGGANLILWLHPLMIAYKYLGVIIGNNLTIRILFYFPAIVLAILGPFALTKYLKLSKEVRFFASLIYLLNTYFLLLVDGGQVGVVLAYGIFPFSLLCLIKLLDSRISLKRSFWLALIVLFLQTLADPRMTVIALLTAFIWRLNFKQIKGCLLLVLALMGLTACWWLPLLKTRVGISTDVVGLQLSSLLDGLALRAPHWPGNVYGEIVPMPFYFLLIPVLIFGGLLLRHKKDQLVIILLFLIFAFLSKGSTPPLGGYYSFLVDLPFGFALRDSTKFFVPLILFAGILIGQTLENLSKTDLFKNYQWLSKVALLMFYGYLLFLVSPALLGRMNFVLSKRQHSEDYEKIYRKLESEAGFFRTAWFPERHPLAFETEEKPAVDAKEIVDLRPLSEMNAGSFDRFNYLHNKNFGKWFDFLAIRYLIFSADQRKFQLNEEEVLLWEDLEQRVATASGLVKQDWGTEVNVYKNSETLPRTFAVEGLDLVVGGFLDTSDNLPAAALYFEDGKWNPNTLNGLASESALIVFNDKEKTDLAMSFLQEFFIGPNEMDEAEWAVYGTNDYLTYKYQLLIKGYEYKDFDYGKGIAFSTQPGEKMRFRAKVPESGNYIVVKRMAEPGKGFHWLVSDPRHFEKGWHSFEIQSQGELTILNVVAIVPEGKYNEAQRQAEAFVEQFGVKEVFESSDLDWNEVEYEKVSPAKYKVVFPEKARWLIFTDNYNQDWLIKRDKIKFSSVPAYSIVNAFYIQPGWEEAEMVFKGQDEIKWGVRLSAVSGLILAIIYLWKRK